MIAALHIAFLPTRGPAVFDVDDMTEIIYIDKLVHDNFSGEEMLEYNNQEKILSEKSNPKNVVECENEDEKSK